MKLVERDLGPGIRNVRCCRAFVSTANLAEVLSITLIGMCRGLVCLGFGFCCWFWLLHSMAWKNRADSFKRECSVAGWFLAVRSVGVRLLVKQDLNPRWCVQLIH